MQRIVFTNARGQSVELKSSAPFLLQSIDGLGDVDADIQTQKAPFQDGSTYIDSVLQERPISMQIAILARDTATLLQHRQYLAAVFNPKLGPGTLRYENDEIVREIKAVPDGVPAFPSGKENRGPRFQKALVNLLCPDPFWLTEEKVDQLVVWEGGLEFPLELPAFFAQQSDNKAKILFNGGDEKTPIFVTFHGPATAPIKIMNVTTDEFIEVNQSLLVGERLEINTAFGQKRVTKILADGTEVNAFHYISLDSTFFQLIPGNNLLDYSTGADYERAAVTITWRNRYLSV
ncbi:MULTISPECIES: phage tail family protein [Geobacillus]|uniref:Phage-related protein (Tail protein) n=1 Tax=Geobacillus kaustophilus (strain HTA426) TaxID=235909 RepID=Q5L2K5_GEOKA|nr:MULTISPECIES: phage tail family protein [Geobacillus]MBW7642413.1 phage tail family protein [Geobacillus thermoleovorans]MCK7604863.1 phage tail family protein [Geobacillus stearothermophilus]BAD74825.1 phage-related protein (tail protein) [Geobacillus kaustophilus HTA426]